MPDSASNSIGLTEALARFIAAPPFETAPHDAADVAKMGITDAIGTMLAGATEPPVTLIRELVAKRSRPGASSVLLASPRIGMADAALVNGTAAHALDFDDVALSGHPSAALMPAIIAAGEALGASGAQVVRAYVIGYEVWAELVARDADAYHVKGWHPTAVLGTVAAAAAVAHLHRLPAVACGHAIALAASMASGLVANFGTMAKPLHAGRAAACGIEAVQLAALGFTAASDAFEHRVGYLAALSPKGNVDLGPPKAIGTRLRILEQRLSIKLYPVCYGAHRIIDGVIDLARQHDLKAEDVREVRCAIGPAQASMLRNHAPATALAAKFSLEFAVASALSARAVGIEELNDAFVTSPSIQGMMPRVRTTIVDTQCPVEPVFSLTDQVVIELRDGRVLDSGGIRFARGNAMLPLGRDALRAKFIDCCSAVDRVDAERLFDALEHLEGVERVTTLSEVAAATNARCA